MQDIFVRHAVEIREAGRGKVGLWAVVVEFDELIPSALASLWNWAEVPPESALFSGTLRCPVISLTAQFPGLQSRLSSRPPDQEAPIRCLMKMLHALLEAVEAEGRIAPEFSRIGLNDRKFNAAAALTRAGWITLNGRETRPKATKAAVLLQGPDRA